MKIIRDDAWRAFLDIAAGQRIKRVRDEALTPGGRCVMHLFERVDDGRPHPRMRFTMPPATDPAPTPLFATEARPTDLAGAQATVTAARRAVADQLELMDLDGMEPTESPRYWYNSVRCQRIGRFFDEARAAARGWALPAADAKALGPWLRSEADAAFATRLQFDDVDTGTYHSYGHDAPFVHFIEAMLASLPAEDGPGFAALPDAQQAAIRRQRAQAQSHLDALMRHKYAYNGVEETDAERSIGGFLVDRETRRILSETPESRDALVPTYELLRIEPDGGHADAGTWVYRADDGLRRMDHSTLEAAEGDLRRVPVPTERVTVQRAPGHPHLRAGIRLDWDGNGYVQPSPIDWVSWAGHCDIKAIMEQLGVTLEGAAPLTEWRSDSDAETVYDRALQLEMVAAVMEFGSLYRRADGSGRLSRGVHHFGGFRNDSLPDRIQFTGPQAGRGFRFPLTRRKETFTVTGLQDGDTAIDLGAAFLACHADRAALSISKNPRFLKMVEQDYAVIDVSGMVVEAAVQEDAIDPQSGYPIRRQRTVTVDLRPDAPAGRDRLGSWLDDAAARTMYVISYDRGAQAIIAERFTHEKQGGAWVAVAQPAQDVTLPMKRPVEVTLSREMKRDDPGAFQTLIEEALHRGRNINADTDMTGPVWNGTVTAMEVERIARTASGVEHWDIRIKARFGEARMEYLMERDAAGAPATFAPLPSVHDWEHWPDFLWQDFPDVGSKGREGADWIINEKMLQRSVVSQRQDPSVAGGVYVDDDYIKNLYELIFSALSGHRWTIVHANKRFGFTDEASWRAARARIAAARDGLTWQRPRLDLNVADADALDALPAIGRVLAGRIIKLRADLGGLVSVEDLLRVNGIGPGRLDRIRGLVRVS